MTTEVFSMQYAPCPVLGKRTVYRSTIICVFYAWSVPKVCRDNKIRLRVVAAEKPCVKNTKPSGKRTVDSSVLYGRL
jgi:hypothetical protein